MTSGTIEFYIDGVKCPDTNGVGVGAIGGVFNCGLTGTTFEAICTTTCEPMMSIVEVFLFKDTAMNLFGSHYYVGDGSASTTNGNDTGYLFTTGSYWWNSSSWQNMFTAVISSPV